MRPLPTPKVFRLHRSSLRSLNLYTKQRTPLPLFRSSPAHTPAPPTTRSARSHYCYFLKEISGSCQLLLIPPLFFPSRRERHLIWGMLSLRSPLGYPSSSLVHRCRWAQVRICTQKRTLDFSTKFDDRETAQGSDSQRGGRRHP